MKMGIVRVITEEIDDGWSTYYFGMTGGSNKSSDENE